MHSLINSITVTAITLHLCTFCAKMQPKVQNKERIKQLFLINKWQACYSLFTVALFRQDGARVARAQCDDVGLATDDGGSQRRLKLPAAQSHICLTTGRFHLREKLQTKKKRVTASPRVAIAISARSLHDSWSFSNNTDWLISST